jgi:hypothetical protein
MPERVNGIIKQSAYRIAWEEFTRLPSLTPDEKEFGPNKLRRYIQVLVEVGERDPSKIARSALAMVRQYEQIIRSRARVAAACLPSRIGRLGS